MQHPIAGRNTQQQQDECKLFPFKIKSYVLVVIFFESWIPWLSEGKNSRKTQALAVVSPWRLNVSYKKILHQIFGGVKFRSLRP